MQPVFRFAPSPNGHLHLGHAYSALLNARMASETGGRFLVRIEDIDLARCTEALVRDCLEDIAWLGLEWEQPVLRQSRHFSRYSAVAAELEGEGLAYPCFCTRGEIAAAANGQRDPDGAYLYPGTCRHLSAEARAHRIGGGAPFALRLDMHKAMQTIGGSSLEWREVEGAHPARAVAAHPPQWGDVVLVRKDCPTSYHLSVVIDDAFQGVTHVVRGQDLFEATAVHTVLQALLALPAPLYHHHPLIRDAEGRKLSKSEASTPLRQLRRQGASAADIRARLGFQA